jgi:hypothetical protein
MDQLLAAAAATETAPPSAHTTRTTAAQTTEKASPGGVKRTLDKVKEEEEEEEEEECLKKGMICKCADPPTLPRMWVATPTSRRTTLFMIDNSEIPGTSGLREDWTPSTHRSEMDNLMYNVIEAHRAAAASNNKGNRNRNGSRKGSNKKKRKVEENNLVNAIGALWRYSADDSEHPVAQNIAERFERFEGDWPALTNLLAILFNDPTVNLSGFNLNSDVTNALIKTFKQDHRYNANITMAHVCYYLVGDDSDTARSNPEKAIECMNRMLLHHLAFREYVQRKIPVGDDVTLLRSMITPSYCIALKFLSNTMVDANPSIERDSHGSVALERSVFPAMVALRRAEKRHKARETALKEKCSEMMQSMRQDMIQAVNENDRQWRLCLNRISTNTQNIQHLINATIITVDALTSVVNNNNDDDEKDSTADGSCANNK